MPASRSQAAWPIAYPCFAPNKRRGAIGLAAIATAIAAAIVAGLLAGCGALPSGCGPRRAGRESRDTARLICRPTDRASAQNPAFSPDGKTILFTIFHEGYNDGPAGLYTTPVDGDRIPADGGRPARLLDEPDTDSVNLPGSSWNETTGRITLASDRGEVDEVWTATPAGKNLFRVTRHRGARYFIEPSFSPDGRWIVFEVDPYAQEEKQQGSIFKVRSDGRGLTRLTDGPRGGTDDRLPNWSPSGERILFQRRKPGADDWDIYTMRSDGTALRRVTRSPSSDTDASWSPDGRWICFSSDDGGLSAPNIFIISAAGGRPVRVTHSATQEHGAPSWSPDGLWIAFESHSATEEDSPASLWRVEAPPLQ